MCEELNINHFGQSMAFMHAYLFMAFIYFTPQIAVETIQNIRTVASLGRESTFYSDYVKALMIPYK